MLKSWTTKSWKTVNSKMLSCHWRPSTKALLCLFSYRTFSSMVNKLQSGMSIWLMFFVIPGYMLTVNLSTCRLENQSILHMFTKIPRWKQRNSFHPDLLQPKHIMDRIGGRGRSIFKIDRRMCLKDFLQTGGESFGAWSCSELKGCGILFFQPFPLALTLVTIACNFQKKWFIKVARAPSWYIVFCSKYSVHALNSFSVCQVLTYNVI